MTTQNNQTVTALIAVKSSERREALHALLESIAGINVIEQASDAQTSIDKVVCKCPALVLVDFSLFSSIRAHCQQEVMVLVSNREEQKLVLESYAVNVFIEGTPVSQMVTAIEGMLHTK